MISAFPLFTIFKGIDMTKFKLLLFFTILTIFSLFLFSCIDSAGGLFYSLEKENEINDGTLENNLSIGAMEKSAGYYFIASGMFKYRNPDKTADWTDSYPSGAAEYLCYDMMLVNDNIFTIFYNQGATDFKYVSCNVSSPENGITWQDSTFTNIPSGESVRDFVHSHNRIFLVTINNDGKFLIYSAPAAGFNKDFDFNAAGSIISDLTTAGKLKVDFDGTDYWIAFGNKIFKGDGATQTGTSDISQQVYDAVTTLKKSGFSGLLCAGGNVYLATKEGVMLKSNGTAWSAMNNPGDDAGLFPGLFGIKRFTTGSIDVIVTGSEKGYYIMDMNQAVKEFKSPENSQILTEANQYNSIALKNSIITDFFVDDEKLFALGYNSGLWQNSINTKTGKRNWSIE